MKRILILAGVLFLMAGSAFAQTADEIVSKANMVSYYAGKDGISDAKMTITDSQGRERNREFRILRKTVKEGAEQKFYVYFKKPTDVEKMVYMVWKNIGKDDDRWLYLPALDLVRRIAASDKRSSFVGSHFVYEDVSGRGTEADTHELLGEEENSYKIKNMPKDTKGLEFSYYIVLIDKGNFMPMKAEYYDADGNLMRTIEALDVKDIDGHPTVVKSRSVDVARGGQTVMEFTNVRYDVGIEDNVFTERYLRRPAMQWIQ
ncbi:MAG: outer membrane lipoprotein-sorting protein [Candidatus Aceula meridiana]|nr:outer membrane lipoprotein-sorting protein [Candidatus Aceula meridiana]